MIRSPGEFRLEGIGDSNNSIHTTNRIWFGKNHHIPEIKSDPEIGGSMRGSHRKIILAEDIIVSRAILRNMVHANKQGYLVFFGHCWLYQKNNKYESK